MDNGIYLTLARQLALFRDMEATANNVANANTTGYNAEHIMFNTYLSKDINKGERNPMLFGYDIRSYRDTNNGGMKITNNPLDVAIQGNAYFAIQTPLGIRYTRAGNFQMDSSGAIITAEGYGVLDNSNQPIVLPEDTVTIDIGEVGNIKINGEDFATLNLVQFENPQLLERLNGRLYKSEINPQPALEARVAQGMLENANVQPVLELTHMIHVSRSVDSTAKFIETMYDLERKSANAWAQQS